MAGYWLSSFFTVVWTETRLYGPRRGCMDRDEAVSAEEKSRFGYRAKTAPIRIFNLSRENLFSPAHLPPLCACSSPFVRQSIAFM